jgi:hypothetical protein
VASVTHHESDPTAYYSVLLGQFVEHQCFQLPPCRYSASLPADMRCRDGRALEEKRFMHSLRHRISSTRL